MKEYKEYKVGEQIILKVKQSIYRFPICCRDCFFFYKGGCGAEIMNCIPRTRSDRKQVIFVEKK